MLANHILVDYSLRQINKYTENIDAFAAAIRYDFKNYEDDGGDYLSGILNVVLAYIYAGKEQEGWQYFYGYYHLTDREEVADEIIARLTDDRWEKIKNAMDKGKISAKEAIKFKKYMNCSLYPYFPLREERKF